MCAVSALDFNKFGSGPVRIALFIHGADDTYAALAAGERIISHRNPTSLAVDVYVHWTNDGKTVGDGLGD